jgi:hypothetical protein
MQVQVHRALVQPGAIGKRDERRRDFKENVMGDLSIGHWAVIAGLGWVLFSVLGSRKDSAHAYGTYVIKEWFASDTPNEDGIYVHIKGRKAGLISFALSLVGINPIVSLVVDRENVRFMEGTWHGFQSYVTPIEKICSGNYGYAKPFWGTVIAVVIGVALLLPSLGVSLILIVGAIVYYFFNKTTRIGLAYVSGNSNGFAFKRSIIEGENIDELAAGRIVSIIEMITLGKEKLSAVQMDTTARASAGIDVGEQARQKMDVLKAQAMRAGERAASKVAASLASASENMPRVPSAPELKCLGCGENVTAEDKFCGSCGRAVR